MEFEYKGGNCVVITSKQGVIVIDGRLSLLGLKDVQPKDAIELATQVNFSSDAGRVAVDMPGEYEISEISIHGIAASRMIDQDGSLKATLYRVAFPSLAIGILGHIAIPLTDDQLENLGVVDVLIIPVGGGGYTLDAHHAVEMVHKINPRVIIPTHYADTHTTYEVPQDSLEVFLETLGAPHETLPKWKIKNGVLPDTQTVIVLKPFI